jgi:hypothetical protein
MKDPETPPPDKWTTSDSRDCVNVLIEAEGDSTIRPCPPELLERMMAERDRIARLQAEIDKRDKSR